MTSRIQEDGGGTEAKWADIDDDEDDWAPETIEWTDGTKVTLSHTEPAPAPPAAAPTAPISQAPSVSAATSEPAKLSPQPPAAAPPPEPTPTREPVKMLPKPATSIGPNATVLRVGANAERQAKSAAAVMSKGPGDKALSSSTSPAPVPAKSPWAPLPPIERAPPVVPPVQSQHHVPFSVPPRDSQATERINGPVAPQEIAADDFNRTWRDGQPSAPRELFNSRSGRYEPVLETRKGGAWRGEQSVRAPAVLQRPSQHDPKAPAEPSPAFQTHRKSAQDAQHWGRRRTSSNVSAGSGTFGRRMSIGRADIPNPVEMRRGSLVNGMVEPPSAMARDTPQALQRHGRGISPGPSGPSANLQSRAPVRAHGPSNEQLPLAPRDDRAAPAPAPVEDPVALQERIMKEKRLEARQRRLEQEQREEAERRERIRLKLEALGPPPEKVKAKSKDAAEAGKAEVVAPASAPTTVQSPPKPPVPEPTGEPKQYGMMKVHHPEAVKKLVAATDKGPDKADPVSGVQRIPSPSGEEKVDAADVNGIRQKPEPPLQPQERQTGSKFDEKGPQWKGSLNASTPYPSWSANSKLGGPSAAVANPWKPLSNDKTLGNGIFDQSLGAFPVADVPLRGHLTLDQSAVGAQNFTAVSGPQDVPPLSSLPSPDSRHLSYDPLSPISRPAPIGPPRSQQDQWHPDDANRANGTATWNNFHIVAAKREAEENEKLRKEMGGMRDRPSKLEVTFHETWKQVHTGDQAGQRQVIGTVRTLDGTSAMVNPLPTLDHPVGGLAFPDSHSRPLGPISGRSSRFFPQVSEPPRRIATDEDFHHRSPSPPPPEEVSSHPVFMGFSDRPHVHLPTPKPVVKLPPRIIAPLRPPPTFASMAAATVPARPAQPQPPPPAVSMATSWQEKINGLFGKRTGSDKRNALAVTSASKEPLDVQLHLKAVAVSLPHIADLDLLHVDPTLTSRQVEEEEEMFEDREAGSLPVVRVPHMAPPAAWIAAPPPSQARLRARNLKPMQVHSIEPYVFEFYDKDQAGNIRVSIRLPGAAPAKLVPLPKKGGSHVARSKGSSSHKSRKHTAKPRDGPGSSGSKKSASSQQDSGSASSPRRQPRNAGRGPRSFSSGTQ